MKIDKMLKELENLGYSDDAVAKKTGFSAATISRIRRKIITNCKIDTAERIRMVFESITHRKVENFC